MKSIPPGPNGAHHPLMSTQKTVLHTGKRKYIYINICLENIYISQVSAYHLTELALRVDWWLNRSDG